MVDQPCGPPGGPPGGPPISLQGWSTGCSKGWLLRWFLRWSVCWSIVVQSVQHMVDHPVDTWWSYASARHWEQHQMFVKLSCHQAVEHLWTWNYSATYYEDPDKHVVVQFNLFDLFEIIYHPNMKHYWACRSLSLGHLWQYLTYSEENILPQESSWCCSLC